MDGLHGVLVDGGERHALPVHPLHDVVVALHCCSVDGPHAGVGGGVQQPALAYLYIFLQNKVRKQTVVRHFYRNKVRPTSSLITCP